MADNVFRRSLLGVAVAGTLGIVGNASAAVLYQGTFDPVNFSGTYQIKVDNDCLTMSPNGWIANAGTNDFTTGDFTCNVSLQSISASVVSTSPDPVYTGTLDFAPPEISSSSQLYGVNVVGGALDSLDTDLIHHVGASPSTSDDWWLQFTSANIDPCFLDPYSCIFIDALNVGPQVELPKGVYLYYGVEPTIGQPAGTAEYTGIQQIPEPGTLALGLGALAGGWLSRRRKKPVG